MLKDIFWKKKKKSFELEKLKWKNYNCYLKRQYFKFWNIMHPKNKEIRKKHAVWNL